MNGFLEDLEGSFGILFNADVMSYLLRGLMFYAGVSVIAIVFSLLLGVALALARNYCTRGPARVLQKMASIYIELFRNTPLMLWMFVCFVMCPAPAVSKSFAEMLGMSSTVAVKTLFKAIVALTLFTSAIMAEIIRGGLNSVAKGQFEAAYSQGFGMMPDDDADCAAAGAAQHCADAAFSDDYDDQGQQLHGEPGHGRADGLHKADHQQGERLQRHVGGSI